MKHNSAHWLGLTLLLLAPLCLWGQNVDWYYSLEASGSNNLINDIEFDSLNQSYVLSGWEGTADLDPGAGTFWVSSSLPLSAALQKLSPNGDLIWAKTWDCPSSTFFRRLTIGQDGGIYIAGIYKNGLDFDPGPGVVNMPILNNCSICSAGFLMKLDSIGNFVWVKPLHNTSAYGIPSPFNLLFKPNGNLLINGGYWGQLDADPGPGTFYLNSSGTSGDASTFLIEWDAQGNFVSALDVGNYVASGMDIDLSGNILLTGTFQNTTDFDPSPNTLNITASGQTDACVVKLDSNFNLLWARHVAGNGFDAFESIELDEQNSVYAVGLSYSDTLDLDPGPSIYSIPAPNAGQRNGIALKLDSTGNFVWGYHIGGTQGFGGSLHSLCKDPAGFIYVSGITSGNIDLDPGPGSYMLNGGDSTYTFVQKLYPNGNLKEMVGLFSHGVFGTSLPIVLDLDNAYDLYLGGNFRSIFYMSATIDTSYLLTPYSRPNGFLLKIDQCAPTIGSLAMAACDTITINGILYDSTGVYTQTLVNQEGCDSTLNLDITIGIPQASLSFTSCDSLTINNITYTSSGIYTQMLPSSLACDSILTLDIIINNSVNTTEIISACDSVVRNGTVYTSSGVYSQTFSLPNGCDSTLFLDLNIGETSQAQIDTTVCEEIFFNGQLYTETGSYLQSYTSIEGCDSLVVLVLTIDTVEAVSVNVDSIGLLANVPTGTYQWWDCDLDSAVAGANFQSFTPSTTGNYAVILTQNGCSDTSDCVNFLMTDVEAVQPAKNINLYPNPTSGSFQIVLDKVYTELDLILLNAQGQQMSYTKANGTKKLEIEIDHAPGLYFVVLKGKDWQKTLKLVKI